MPGQLMPGQLMPGQLMPFALLYAVRCALPFALLLAVPSALPALPWIMLYAAAVGLLEAMAFLHRLFLYPSIEMHVVEG